MPHQSRLLQAISGDVDALSDLLEESSPQLRARLRGQIPVRWQSLINEDDVLQETYAEAFIDIGSFRETKDGSFLGWLATIAQRNLVDAIRELAAERRGGSVRRVESPSLENSTAALYDVLQMHGTTPSQAVAKREAADLVREAVSQLPEAYARVVQLYDLEGLSADQVAQTLGCTSGAMYMRRARAHRSLQVILARLASSL